MNAIEHIRRDLLKLTQVELAELTGVSQGTVSRWESGDLAPSLAELHAIREEALRQRLAWDDGLFFREAPVAS